MIGAGGRLVLGLLVLGTASGCAMGFPAQLVVDALGNGPAASASPRPHPSTRPVSTPTVPPGGGRGALARVVYSGSHATRAIAITIDDGGDTQVCLDMAHILMRMHATATFFPIGRYVGANPRAWRFIGGHFPIGNHTQDHPILTHLSPTAIRAQIEADERTIRAATGHPPIPYLRPPGGAWDASVAQVARSAGYRTLVLWDTTDADTALHSRLRGMMRDALRGGPGSILLMHCNRPLSEQILTRVIGVYRSRGFHFVTIPQMLGGN